MDISSKKVLDKMGELVSKAKHTDSGEKLNGYVTAIHALCDLLLDEKEEHYGAGGFSSPPQPAVSTQPLQQQAAISPQPVITSISQSKPVKMDDANGDSLFDF